MYITPEGSLLTAPFDGVVLLIVPLVIVIVPAFLITLFVPLLLKTLFLKSNRIFLLAATTIFSLVSFNNSTLVWTLVVGTALTASLNVW